MESLFILNLAAKHVNGRNAPVLFQAIDSFCLLGQELCRGGDYSSGEP